MGQGRILIIEDEFITAMNMQRILDKNNYDVVGISGYGEEAVKLVDALRPDLVLMDISLKGDMKGTEAARIIVQKNQTPIIFVTAYSDTETLQDAKYAEPYGYLTKPFNDRDLLISIEMALFKCQMERKSMLATKKIRDDFMANLSHEIRTPLNGIIGFSEILYQGRLGPLNAMQHDSVGDILCCSRHLLDLVNSVLDLEKIKAGKLEFYPESINLDEIVREVVHSFMPLTHQHDISIQHTVSSVLVDIKLDPMRFRQVLYNYLSNAIKFSPDHACIQITIRPEGEEAFRIEVRDQGIGIPADRLPELFMPFHQLEAGNGKHYQGSGLGLALTRQLVAAQGGETGVTSQPGKGSTFYAVLPRVFAVESVMVRG